MTARAVRIPHDLLGQMVRELMEVDGIGGVFFDLTRSQSPIAAQIVNLIWTAVWTAFYAILVAVAYHDLRVAKEGVDTHTIAAVFE